MRCQQKVYRTEELLTRAYDIISWIAHKDGFLSGQHELDVVEKYVPSSGPSTPRYGCGWWRQELETHSLHRFSLQQLAGGDLWIRPQIQKVCNSVTYTCTPGYMVSTFHQIDIRALHWSDMPLLSTQYTYQFKIQAFNYKPIWSYFLVWAHVHYIIQMPFVWRQGNSPFSMWYQQLWWKQDRQGSHLSRNWDELLCLGSHRQHCSSAM